MNTNLILILFVILLIIALVYIIIKFINNNTKNKNSGKYTKCNICFECNSEKDCINLNNCNWKNNKCLNFKPEPSPQINSLLQLPSPINSEPKTDLNYWDPYK